MSNRASEWFARRFGSLTSLLSRRPSLELRYFEDVLAVEFVAINKRRDANNRKHISPLPPPTDAALRSRALVGAPPSLGDLSRSLSPNPAKLFARAARQSDAFARGDPLEQRSAAAAPKEDAAEPHLDPADPNYDKTRPQPVPCKANGLAFSGGGIRSAALCLGVLQAFQARKDIKSIDYLSTVSGGGYIGACLSGAMSLQGGRAFPFGDDVLDSSAVAHLRNYSNYLMPRGRSGVANIAEAGAIILRGLLANVVIVSAAVLFCVLVTLAIHPDFDRMKAEGFTPWLTLSVAVLTILALLVWAVLRSRSWLESYTDDASSAALTVARVLMICVVIAALLDLQPPAIVFVAWIHHCAGNGYLSLTHLGTAIAALGAYSGVVSSLSSFLGDFLKTSARTTDRKTIALRIATSVIIFIAALVLPVAIWIAYLELSLSGMTVAANLTGDAVPGVRLTPAVQVYIWIFCIGAAITWALEANGYSLHRFYRDRLSKAFLFVPPPLGWAESIPLDDLKLSALQESAGPYHIINSALNVEGSKEANRRGRNADFFMFTRDFIGSDLTHYASAEDMEEIDPRLDLATAMAISGAAVSANMGSATIRLLSPTLALLNIQLGYWLRNPLDLGMSSEGWRIVGSGLARLFGKFYLLGEMLNQIDEKSRNVLLTDGGHIENLGIYELLKRGCQLVIVVDAEADPSMSFPALMTLERYARIDLGVRIVLPWEEVAAMTKSVDAHMPDDPIRSNGPHCAIGRIFYQTGAEGIIVYFKSSLTGDEKDYVLDYKKRYPSFPHETTGDQFFSEEQFEVYRALGYHMADGVFGGAGGFSYLSSGPGSFDDREAAIAAISAMLDQSATVVAES
jgi:hypothetical protein